MDAQYTFKSLNDYKLINGEQVDINIYYMEDERQTEEGIALILYGYERIPQNDTKYFFEVPAINNIKGVTKVFGFQELKKNDIKLASKIFRNYIPSFTNMVVATEIMKSQPVEQLNKIYITSNGKTNDKINPTIRSKVIFGVSSILKHLHKNHIIHQYLFRHVFLNDQSEPQVKMAGCSYQIADELETEETLQPTRVKRYLLVEINEHVSFPCDVFSYGFFLYSMFTGKTEGEICTENKKSLLNDGRPPKVDCIPDHYWELIQKCWNKDPAERPTFNEITEILKDDKFALNEFGMKTDLDQLHEYQNRIESD
ncbi:hypothetical protein M9Y10_003641 [Tritrichomonas musculus]|uniref:Protein kinase domain-containing protein n=1 Tax=Tritrichomonas musculus TaxID=1915356 RepID=A0ABR2JPX5_9EUKA